MAAWQCEKIDKKTLKTQGSVGILPPTVPKAEKWIENVPFNE
jgi:hypothetical protein